MSDKALAKFESVRRPAADALTVSPRKASQLWGERQRRITEL